MRDLEKKLKDAEERLSRRSLKGDVFRRIRLAQKVVRLRHKILETENGKDSVGDEHHADDIRERKLTTDEGGISRSISDKS